jgi:hypothetical protein
MFGKNNKQLTPLNDEWKDWDFPTPKQLILKENELIRLETILDIRSEVIDGSEILKKLKEENKSLKEANANLQLELAVFRHEQLKESNLVSFYKDAMFRMIGTLHCEPKEQK